MVADSLDDKLCYALNLAVESQRIPSCTTVPCRTRVLPDKRREAEFPQHSHTRYFIGYGNANATKMSVVSSPAVPLDLIQKSFSELDGLRETGRIEAVVVT